MQSFFICYFKLVFYFFRSINIYFLKNNLPHIRLIEPEGLYLAWVDFRECGLLQDELEKVMLEKAGLWLDEGYIFGTGGEGFERFNLAVPRSTVEDACQRLLKAFQK